MTARTAVRLVLVILLFLAAATVQAAETVYTTKGGAKYHLAGCQHLKHSSIETTLAEAKAKGLGPCSRCRPPQ